MAKITLSDALDRVETTYQELNSIAKEITKDFFEPVDIIFDDLSNVNELTNDDLRDYLVRLALAAFSLAEVKEKASMKAELSEALRKESIARNYVLADGTSAAKDNQAILDSSSEIVGEALFNLVANLFKTKLDQCHRTIDTLKSILMSRNMEAKLSTNVIE